MFSQTETLINKVETALTLLESKRKNIDSSILNDFRQFFKEKPTTATRLRLAIRSVTENLTNVTEDLTPQKQQEIYRHLALLTPHYSLLPYEIRSTIQEAKELILENMDEEKKKQLNHYELLVTNRRAFKSAIKLLRRHLSLDKNITFKELNITNSTLYQQLLKLLAINPANSISEENKQATLAHIELITKQKKCPKILREKLIRVKNVVANAMERDKAKAVLNQYHESPLAVSIKKLIKLIEKKKSIFIKKSSEIEYTNLGNALNVTNIDDPDAIKRLYSQLASLLDQQAKLPKTIKFKLEKLKLALIQHLSWQFAAVPVLPEQELDKKSKVSPYLFNSVVILGVIAFIADGIDGINSIFDVITSFYFISTLLISAVCVGFAIISAFSGLAFELNYVAESLGINFLGVKSFVNYYQKQLDELNFMYEKLLEELKYIKTNDELNAIKNKLAACDSFKNEIEKIQNKIQEATDSSAVTVGKGIVQAITIILFGSDAFFMGTSCALGILGWCGYKGGLGYLALAHPGLLAIVIGAGLLVTVSTLAVYWLAQGDAITKALDKLLGKPFETIENFANDKRHLDNKKLVMSEIRVKELEFNSQASKLKNDQLENVNARQQKQIEELGQKNEKSDQEIANLKEVIARHTETIRTFGFFQSNDNVAVEKNAAVNSPLSYTS